MAPVQWCALDHPPLPGVAADRLNRRWRGAAPATLPQSDWRAGSGAPQPRRRRLQAPVQQPPGCRHRFRQRHHRLDRVAERRQHQQHLQRRVRRADACGGRQCAVDHTLAAMSISASRRTRANGWPAASQIVAITLWPAKPSGLYISRRSLPSGALTVVPVVELPVTLPAHTDRAESFSQRYRSARIQPQVTDLLDRRCRVIQVDGRLAHDNFHLADDSAKHPIEPRYGTLAALLLLAGMSPQRRHAWPTHRIVAHSRASNCDFQVQWLVRAGRGRQPSLVRVMLSPTGRMHPARQRF